LNILIFIPNLDKTKVGGIWQYSVALINTVVEDRENRYFIYLNHPDDEILGIISKSENMQLVNNAAVLHVPLKEKIKRKFRKYSNKLFGRQAPPISALDLICEEFEIDIVHCPYQFLPNTSKTKRIVTLHDVQEIHLPEFFTAEDRLYRADVHLQLVRSADCVLVSYNHVKNDLLKYFNADPDTIRVVLLDMKNLWIERAVEKAPACYPQFPFLLYPANVWMHKNHLGLGKAVLYVRNTFNVEIRIVCTGGNKEPWFQTVATYLQENNLEDNFIFTGSVTEGELLWYYKHCRAVVVPTLYEAGSFPLVESILLQVPVICSNVTSLPETIGDLKFLFNPTDTRDMGSSLHRIWTDDSFLEESRANTVIQTPKITSTGALKILKETYKNIMK